MRLHPATARGAGFTLIELVVAMVASAVLLAGLGSVMLIARQIAYTPTASTERLEASRFFVDLANELRYATFVIERSPHALEFVVADRNSDGTHERIRYAWSGTAGDPLYKTVSGGTPTAALDAVQQLQLDYTVDAGTTTVTTTSDSAEVLLVNNTGASISYNRPINATEWSAQQIDPALFVSAPPANTICWRPTRVEFLCTATTGAAQFLFVQVRSAGQPNGNPTSQVLTGVSVVALTLVNSPAWNNLSLPDSVDGLALHRKYVLVWAGGAIPNVTSLSHYDAAPGSVLETGDGGASWQYISTRRAFVRLYGTYTTPGPSYDVTRSYLSNVFVTLQTGAQQYSRVETSIPLANRPEILSAYWRTDFDSDPTLADANGDGTADWQAAEVSPGDVASPQPYDPDTLIGGVWHASGKLITQPLNDFAATTIVDVGLRDTVPGGSGAVARINADWSAGLHSPLAVRVQMAGDGTQTLTLTGKSDAATDVVLFEHGGLSNDFVRCRLTILPDSDVVNLQINDEDQGTFTYSAYSPSSNDRFLSLFGDTGEAEFDYAEVRVLEP